MSKPEKKKLCWNCEGNVSRTAENCPYCAVYLNPEPATEEPEVKPLYSPQASAGTIPKAPYSPPQGEGAGAQEEAPALKSEHAANSLFRSIFLPITLLTAGLFSILFAGILLLFSTQGVLTLEWDGELWYLYAIAGTPLLFFGWRFLEKP
jgi:hypothetical protein